MFGAKVNSVMVVLQGRDSAGKDGAIKHVAGCLNPRGVNVVSFGVPTAEEREHDFLWRVHRHAPRLGEFAIFNRSHYEDVLVVRVHGLAPKKLWQRALRPHRGLRGAAGRAWHHRPQVLPPHQPQGAEGAPARARAHAAGRVEAECERLEGARALGRLHRGLRGRDLEDRGAACAVDRGAGERQVVPQPGGRGVDRRSAARAPQELEEERSTRSAASAAPSSPPTAPSAREGRANAALLPGREPPRAG